MADPIAVGSDKQLFLDESFLAQRRNITLAVDRPYQDPEPVLVSDRPWESGGIGAYNTVMFEDGRFRLWYDACLLADEPGRFNRQLCYAESGDGVHWEKPDLGIIRFGDSKKNNIVSPPSGTQSQQGATVFRDDGAPPSERYKAWTKLNPAPRKTSRSRPSGLWALTSPDGLRWKFLAEGYPLGQGAAADSQNIVYWDDETGCYVGFVRMKGFPRGRDRTCWVGRMTSRDFRTWTRAKTVFRADAEDESMPLPSGMEVLQPVIDFYTPGGMKYPGAPGSYIMLPTPYHHWDRDRWPSTIDVTLLTSRDGHSWYRPSPREPWLRHGLDGAATSGMLFANPWPIVIGDEVWIYYNGTSRRHDQSGASAQRTGLFRARLRRDGFLAAVSPPEGGSFTTPPLTFSGRRLSLNVDTGAGGWLEVEMLGGGRRPLSGLSRRDCDAVRGNTTARTVTWNGDEDCGRAAGHDVRLRFHMRSTRLYAFQFTP